MDLMKIVGVRDYSFDDAKTGRPVSGTTYFFTMDGRGVDGQMTGKFSVTTAKRQNFDFLPSVGDEVFVDYDRYGKPSRFQLAK